MTLYTIVVLILWAYYIGFAYEIAIRTDIIVMTETPPRLNQQYVNGQVILDVVYCSIILNKS